MKEITYVALYEYVEGGLGLGWREIYFFVRYMLLLDKGQHFSPAWDADAENDIGRASTWEGDKVVSGKFCDELCAMMINMKVKSGQYFIGTTTESPLFIN